MNDLSRAAIMAFVSNVVKVAVLLGGFDLDPAEQMLIIGTVDTGITAFFLVWKKGQGEAPLPSSMVVGEDKAQSKIRKASE